jgi:hypothetical protein
VSHSEFMPRIIAAIAAAWAILAVLSAGGRRTL